MSAGATTGRSAGIALRRIGAILLLPYLAALTFLFVVKRPDYFWQQVTSFRWSAMGRTVNLLPGRTLLYYLTLQENCFTGITQLGGNLLGFVPFGILLPLCCRPARRATGLTSFAAALSLLFELFQFATNVGTFDVDDLLLNVAGAVCGFFMLRWMLKRFALLSL
ncbi:VanZ family protein [Flaviaesturariibacter terrae]